MLEGTVSFVPDGLWAALVLVPAVDAAGLVRVYAVHTEDAGVSVEQQASTLGPPDARLVLHGAPGVALNGDGSEIAEFLRQRSVAALCAYAAGVAEAALTLTAGYVREREQFGKPLATFQAVSQRAADTYTDARSIRLTARQAAWRLGAGLPATMDVAVAKFWACDGGHRVAFATQHLHGGIGVDRDYPLHRYFHAMRRVDVTLGGATEHLRRIGAELAGPTSPESHPPATATAGP
jgi:acyl-CoA dehydrogenase